ncbi:MAG: sigma 54-interacting transcriptional regulator, partial [Candidatus Krumholzibacteriia bacterium]
LFGYRAGAFTGATRDRQGRIAAAEGGTIFLDEIGDMSPAMQVKLLRFLQDRVYERLGDPRPVQADVRVVAATNRSLPQLVAEGRFRRDLFYRINVLNLELPPLRERPRDIPLLAQRCLERLSRARGKPVLALSPAALDALAAHDFPGNVRELDNVVEHAFVVCPGPVIGPEHLPETCRGSAGAAGPARGPTLQDYEARGILDALARAGGSRTGAARLLGLHRTTLLRKARRLGLVLPARDGRAGRGRPGGS